MRLEHFAQMRALEAAYTSTNRRLVDLALRDDETSGVRAQLPLKRIQFDALEAVAADLEKVCSVLDCSKREFLEVAVTEAIDQAMAAYQTTLDRVMAATSGAQIALTAMEG